MSLERNALVIQAGDLSEIPEPFNRSLESAALWRAANLPPVGATPPRDFTVEPITAAELADGAVVQAKLAANSIDESKLRFGSVTSDKIRDGAITYEKYADGSIQSFSLAAGAVTGDKLYPDSVDLAKLSPSVRAWMDSIQAAVDGIPSSGGGGGELEDNSVLMRHLTPSSWTGSTKMVDSTGQYSIYRPDTWPEQTVLLFSGLNGYKRTGVFNTGSGSNGVVVVLPAESGNPFKYRIVNYGGWFCTDQNEVQMIPNTYAGSGSVPTSIALLRADIGGLFLITRTNSNRSNQPYMVWFLYETSGAPGGNIET